MAVPPRLAPQHNEIHCPREESRCCGKRGLRHNVLRGVDDLPRMLAVVSVGQIVMLPHLPVPALLEQVNALAAAMGMESPTFDVTAGMLPNRTKPRKAQVLRASVVKKRTCNCCLSPATDSCR